jgi:diguanylate cyclase (GGDEF)-like protein
MLLPERDNYVLLAPPDQPRVTWSIAAGPDGLDVPETIGEAMRCSGLSLGRTVTVESSTELDACPHLVQHGWEVSSVCIPIRVGEHHLGVAHSAGPAGDLPDEEGRRLLELVTRRVGTRIAALRATRQHSDHVALDPLTRLPGHTVVQRRLRELMSDAATFSIAFCDLDRFAAYNEEHGTEGGDRALRLFSDVMGATLRPGDVIARYAGDRFLCLFPDCTSNHAASAMERVRESLVLELAMQEIDPFTASVGVADAGDAGTVEALLEVADIALAVAKNGGGNRVVVNDFDEIHLLDGPL